MRNVKVQSISVDDREKMSEVTDGYVPATAFVLRDGADMRTMIRFNAHVTNGRIDGLNIGPRAVAHWKMSSDERTDLHKKLLFATMSIYNK